MSGRRVVASLLVALGLVVFAVPALGATSPVKQAVKMARASLVNGNPAAQWVVLHPKYKRVVPRALFVKCARRDAAAGGFKVRSVAAAKGTRQATFNLPLIGKVKVTGAWVSVRHTRRGVKGVQVVKIETYWVRNRGKWVRIMGPDDLQAYRSGKCP